MTPTPTAMGVRLLRNQRRMEVNMAWLGLGLGVNCSWGEEAVALFLMDVIPCEDQVAGECEDEEMWTGKRDRLAFFWPQRCRELRV